ncbi:MAG: hypothetical protein JWQ95_2409, partial [Sphaerisporangium sp.]|nr:hypothetical protein [Sphaerisporangium sp.]
MSTTDIVSTLHHPLIAPIEAAHPHLRITPLLDRQGLRTVGELDCATLPALTRALASMPSNGNICLDLSGLAFIDVGGLRALVTTATGLQGDHVLTLRSASPQVRRLLDLTGWHHAPGLHVEAPADSISCLTD